MVRYRQRADSVGLRVDLSSTLEEDWRLGIARGRISLAVQIRERLGLVGSQEADNPYPVVAGQRADVEERGKGICSVWKWVGGIGERVCSVGKGAGGVWEWIGAIGEWKPWEGPQRPCRVDFFKLWLLTEPFLNTRVFCGGQA